MFWDRVAGIYDIFVNVINSKTHRVLCKEAESLFDKKDRVLECACGTGMLTEVIAGKCKELTATDFSSEMLKRARKKCLRFGNIRFEKVSILDLPYPDSSFDKVVAANVIHLLDEPYKALSELDRVCRRGGMIIIPTYINKTEKGRTSGFAKTVGKAGADFKRQFTFRSYQDFFKEAGYKNVSYKLIDGRIPCALAIIKKL